MVTLEENIKTRLQLLKLLFPSMKLSSQWILHIWAQGHLLESRRTRDYKLIGKSGIWTLYYSWDSFEYGDLTVTEVYQQFKRSASISFWASLGKSGMMMVFGLPMVEVVIFAYNYDWYFDLPDQEDAENFRPFGCWIQCACRLVGQRSENYLKWMSRIFTMAQN